MDEDEIDIHGECALCSADTLIGDNGLCASCCTREPMAFRTTNP